MDNEKISFGQRCAETIAKTVGSWKFIIILSAILIVWAVLNGLHIFSWDPYPFILMNLFLSLQAAYTAPLILMSQNRQNEKDRKMLHDDYVLDANSNKRLKKLESKLDQVLEKLSQ